MYFAQVCSDLLPVHADYWQDSASQLVEGRVRYYSPLNFFVAAKFAAIGDETQSHYVKMIMVYHLSEGASCLS